MKTIILAVLLSTTVPVQAQQLNKPKTINLFNNATKEPLGTATLLGNKSYIRDKNGEHIATIVQNPDGSKTSYDPHGNVIESLKLPK